ncbi:hypothetical protein T484DRAFT_1901620 [Baffinella frigidus]|nr:hypothetical protein T484DRAFT_1901620 [Cryptophyta sp. CCMP2293]
MGALEAKKGGVEEGGGAAELALEAKKGGVEEGGGAAELVSRIQRGCGARGQGSWTLPTCSAPSRRKMTPRWLKGFGGSISAPRTSPKRPLNRRRRPSRSPQPRPHRRPWGTTSRSKRRAASLRTAAPTSYTRRRVSPPRGTSHRHRPESLRNRPRPHPARPPRQERRS